MEEFKDRTVVVVGMGCSALDAAVEISSHAKQVYLSTRSGAWVMNRVGPRGYPMDAIMLRRYLAMFLDFAPISFCSWYLEKMYLDPQFHHSLYRVKPKHHFLCKDPSINDLLPAKLLSGSVIQKADIERFTQDGVVFQGDDYVTAVDDVIMGTGYGWQFPFLEEGIIQEENGRINLYKGMFPNHLKHHTLAIIGFLLPFGPSFPINELQCRYAARLLAGSGKLPSEKTMLLDISKRHRKNEKRYSYSDKTSLRVDYVPHMDEIASLIGVKPKLLKMLFTDVKLFWKLLWGPSVPYQYRLHGPHKWEGARDAILSVDKRIKKPLKGNCTHTQYTERYRVL